MAAGLSPRSDWTGLLLAGGQSARMGQDKGQLPSAGLGSPILYDAALASLRPCCAKLLVVGGSLSPEQGLLDVQFLADAELYAGPLAALQNVLSVLTTDWVLVLPMDMPALPLTLLQQGQCAALDAANATPTSRGLYSWNGEHGACFPLWISVVGIARLQELHQQGERSLFAAAKRAGLCGWELPAGVSACGGDPFRNLNTPADLVAWQAVCSQNQKSR